MGKKDPAESPGAMKLDGRPTVFCHRKAALIDPVLFQGLSVAINEIGINKARKCSNAQGIV